MSVVPMLAGVGILIVCCSSSSAMMMMGGGEEDPGAGSGAGAGAGAVEKTHGTPVFVEFFISYPAIGWNQVVKVMRLLLKFQVKDFL